MNELDDLARTAAERCDTEILTTTHINCEVWRAEAAVKIADIFRPLAERAVQLEAMLRRVAWRRQGLCPICAGSATVHFDGCELAALLAPAPPQVFPEALSDDIWASELSARVEALECWRASQRNDFGEHDEPKPMPAWEAELRHGELHRANPFVCAAVAEIDRLRAEVAEAAARDAWRDIAENVLKRKLAERTSERNEALAEAAALRKVRDAAQAYRVCPTGCYQAKAECEALLDEALAAVEPTETK